MEGVSHRAPAVVVEGLSKTFRFPHHRLHTLKERALHPFRRYGHDDFQALQDISFEVPEGEFLGIVGRNGSGKSTLLKCLAGIYAKDSGTIQVNGRLSTFIELGVGFNPDLAARDNVLLNGVMLGLSPREARLRFDRILAFSELEEFVELKIKNYSSGMLVRLAFSVMIHVDADILLIDEVLAVGDAAFQQKCFDEFARIRKERRTVLLVTHEMAAVERFCDRAILLERGKMISEGDPRTVGNDYVEINFAGEEERAAGELGQGDPDRFGDRSAEIVEAWFEDEAGERAATLPTGRRCSFAFRVCFKEDLEDPVFGFNLQNSRQETVLSASSLEVEENTGHFQGGEELTVRAGFDNIFSADRYSVTPAVARAGGFAWVDRRERFGSVLVTGTRSTDAVVDIPCSIEVERLAEPPRGRVSA